MKIENVNQAREFLEMRDQLRKVEAERDALKSQLGIAEDTFREIKKYASHGEASMKKIFGGRTFLPIVQNVLNIVNQYQQDRSNAKSLEHVDKQCALSGVDVRNGE